MMTLSNSTWLPAFACNPAKPELIGLDGVLAGIVPVAKLEITVTPSTIRLKVTVPEPFTSNLTVCQVLLVIWGWLTVSKLTNVAAVLS